jgi:hypothetical protein
LETQVVDPTFERLNEIVTPPTGAPPEVTLSPAERATVGVPNVMEFGLTLRFSEVTTATNRTVGLAPEIEPEPFAPE